jgi:hypothetical protein
MRDGPGSQGKSLHKIDAAAVKKPPIMRMRDPSPMASLSTSIKLDERPLSRDRSASALGVAMQKQRQVQLGIPTLDFSNLKQVTDYKDWYGYSQKLELAIKLMREKIDGLKQEREMSFMQIEQLEKQVESLTDSNVKMAE